MERAGLKAVSTWNGALVPLERVRGRRQKAAVASEQREHVVIVGNGMVGQRLCERLIAAGERARLRLTIIGDEPTPAYDRVHLSELWRGKPAHSLVWRTAEWYASAGVELRLGQAVHGVDAERRVVSLSDGSSVHYDKLVLATGARARLPTVPVQDGAELLGYRTLDDAQRILQRLEAGILQRLEAGVPELPVAVIGGGLLGVEAARTLQQLGCSVVVLEASSQLLPRQLDAEAAAVLEQLLSENGIQIRTRERIERIGVRDGCTIVALESGDELPVALVVAAAGARPCDDLARAAGLSCDSRGGVLVDERLRTSAERIFAIGDCASHRDVPAGLVAPGYVMADVLADRLLGGRRRLTPQRAITRLKLDLTEVTVLGNPLSPDPVQDKVWRSGALYRRLVLEKGRVVAAIAIGPWDELLAVEERVLARKRLSAKELARFAESGSVGAASRDVADWKDTAVVCQCHQVTCGKLRSAMRGGACTAEALTAATGAGSLCGSCKPLLGALCGGPRVVAPSSGRGLAAAAAIAASVAIAIAVLPRLPVATTVQRVDVSALWIESTFKQVSGYVLLALAVAAALLSVRRRWLSDRFGSYRLWRTVHAWIGALAVVTLVAHTGLRLGANLNLALMLTFLATILTGAGAAAWSRLSEAGGGVARALRAARVLHDVVYWLLPPLIGFHVLKVYYF